MRNKTNFNYFTNLRFHFCKKTVPVTYNHPIIVQDTLNYQTIILNIQGVAHFHQYFLSSYQLLLNLVLKGSTV